MLNPGGGSTTLPGQEFDSDFEVKFSVFNSICSKCSRPGGAPTELLGQDVGCEAESLSGKAGGYSMSGRPRTPDKGLGPDQASEVQMQTKQNPFQQIADWNMVNAYSVMCDDAG